MNILVGVLLLTVCLALLCSQAWTDTSIERKAIWAIQAPTNQPSLQENIIVDSFKIVVAEDNTSYVCGSMSGGKISFGDVTVYTDLYTHSGFVLVLYPDGTEKFVISLNATGNVFCYGLALVSDGFYLSGSFSGNFTGDFAAQFPASELKDISDVSGQTARGFFVKYHPDGTVFDYSLNVLGSEDHFAEIIALSSDGEDNLYLVGNFNGNMTVGSEILESFTDSSALYAKFFNRTFLDAQMFGGNGSTFVFGIATNADGYSCIIGSSSETATIGNVTLTSLPVSLYFQQFNSDGTQLWFDSMTTIDSVSFGVQIDDRRACSFAGPFQNFLQRSNNEVIEVPGTGSFFAKYRPDGNNAVLETTRGDVFDYFSDLSCSDSTGSCSVTGFYDGNITIQGVTYSNNDGFPQYFVAKFDNDGNFSGLINGTGVASGASLYVKNDNLWVTGTFQLSLAIDGFNLSSTASTALFTVRYTQVKKMVLRNSLTV